MILANRTTEEYISNKFENQSVSSCFVSNKAEVHWVTKVLLKNQNTLQHTHH